MSSFDKGREKALQEITNKASKVGVQLENGKSKTVQDGKYSIYIEEYNGNSFGWVVRLNGKEIDRQHGHTSEAQALEEARETVRDLKRDDYNSTRFGVKNDPQKVTVISNANRVLSFKNR